MLRCEGYGTLDAGLFPFKHWLTALVRAQMETTQTKKYFVLGIWVRFAKKNGNNNINKE